jgi:hypothetical protein
MDPSIVEKFQRKFKHIINNESMRMLDDHISNMSAAMSTISKEVREDAKRQLEKLRDMRRTMTTNRVDRLQEELKNSPENSYFGISFLKKYSDSNLRMMSLLIIRQSDLERELKDLQNRKPEGWEQLKNLKEEEITVLQSYLNTVKPLNLVSKSLTVSLAFAADQIIKTFGELRQFGFSYNQSFTRLLTDIKTSVVSLLRGEGLISPRELARAQGSFGQSQLYGNIPQGLEQTIKNFTTLGGMDIQSFTDLAYRIMQINKWSTETASSWTNTLMNIAHANNIPMDVMVRKTAESMSLLANASNRNVSELSKMIIESARLNINMQNISAVGDNLTSSFETYLDAQAKLQTILPGTDLTGVMMAAQFGSESDLMDALSSMLGGRDIGTLPRSLRNMISGAIGMDVNDLVKLSTTDTMIDELKLSREALEKIRDSVNTNILESLIGRTMGTLATNLTKGVELVLTALLFRSVAGIGGGTGGMLSGMGSAFSVGAGGALAASAKPMFPSMTTTLGSRALGAAKTGFPWLAGIGSGAMSLLEGEGIGEALTKGGIAGLSTLAATMGIAALSLPAWGSALAIGGATIGAGFLADKLGDAIFDDNSTSPYSIQSVSPTADQATKSLEVNNRQNSQIIDSLGKVKTAVENVNNTLRDMGIVTNSSGESFDKLLMRNQYSPVVR